MKAFRAIGFQKALKYLWFTLLYVLYRFLILPQLRVIYLRMLGARIGKNSIIHDVRFFNYYRTGFSGLKIGNECFLGDATLLDLAAPLVFEDQVTLAERVTILTHLNVGYENHPLQKTFPATAKGVVIRRGSFIGTAATILDGVEIGPESFIAAGALVKESCSGRQLLAGVPAKLIRTF